jgi:DNA polymerase III alpha subunit
MTNENKYGELESLILSINHEKSYVFRLKKEISFIKSKGTAKFLLSAFEVTNDLKQNGVIIGPTNGFSNSSLINYLLGFTTINPIKYDLICEPYFNLNYSFLVRTFWVIKRKELL